MSVSILITYIIFRVQIRHSFLRYNYFWNVLYIDLPQLQKKNIKINTNKQPQTDRQAAQHSKK